MSNQLANENSPYLIQHADNPVSWYPWGDEALSLAKKHDKPIFLSIGYSACHWCHVMAHESFEDPEIAEILNEHFVNIKVDREERPDVDSIYMNAVVALTGQGGWPLSVFLTPEGAPFYGGTYFPPTPRFNMPSFKELLLGVNHAWQSQRENINQNAGQLSNYLQDIGKLERGNGELSSRILEEAVDNLQKAYDWNKGGWGKAPKFPQPLVIKFLIRRAAKGDIKSLEMVIHALEAMAKGGMYDVVGGGFARYSTDDSWLIPHFEKMLYDNALLARVYLHAYMVTGKVEFKKITEETLDFITREMTDPKGGFYSSLDADSEGVEGKYYTWNVEEIEAVLSSTDAKFLCAAYGITGNGNFEGTNVLQRQMTDEELAQLFDMSIENVTSRLSELILVLREVRSERVRPAMDDKCLVMWNALMCVAFSEAGRYLGVSNYVDMATRNLDFMLSELLHEDNLYRSWRNGRVQISAYLEDYAALCIALITHYQIDPNPRWFKNALQLVEIIIRNFRSNSRLFYDADVNQTNLIIRPREIQDNATPSGNSLTASALLHLSYFTGNSEWRGLVDELLDVVLEYPAKHPLAFGNWLCAIDRYLSPSREIAIVGDLKDPLTKEFIQAIWSKFRPNLTLAISDWPIPHGSPQLLSNRSLINGLPTAYVCHDFVCDLPTNSISDFVNQLDGD